MERTRTIFAILLLAPVAYAQGSETAPTDPAYRNTAAYSLLGGSAIMSGSVIKKDRHSAKIWFERSETVFGQGNFSMYLPAHRFEIA